jgi:hypothetical protein
VRSYAERWANLAVPVTLPGGATAAAPGTEQIWDLAGGLAGWPPVDPAARELLRIYDPAMPLEIIAVTERPLPGQPAQARVIRGDQGSTATGHRPGAVLHPCISAEGLAARAQGTPSGTGLVLGTATELADWTSASNPARTIIASVLVPAGEAAAGAVYEAYAFGYYTTTGATGTAGMFFEQDWGDATLGSHQFTGQAANISNCRWKVHGWVNIHPGNLASGTADVLLGAAPGTAANPVRQYMIGPSADQPIDPAADVTYRLLTQLTAPGMHMWVLGGRAWRAA